MVKNKKIRLSIIFILCIIFLFAVLYFLQRSNNLLNLISNQYSQVNFNKQSLVTQKINDNRAVWIYGSQGHGNELYFFFLKGNKVIYSKVFTQSSTSQLEWGHKLINSNDSTIVVCGAYLKDNLDRVTIENIPQDNIYFNYIDELTVFFSVAKHDKDPVKITGFKDNTAIFKNYPDD